MTHVAIIPCNYFVLMCGSYENEVLRFCNSGPTIIPVAKIEGYIYTPMDPMSTRCENE